MGGRGQESEEGEMGKEAKGRMRMELGRERGGEGGGAEGTKIVKNFLNKIYRPFAQEIVKIILALSRG